MQFSELLDRISRVEQNVIDQNRRIEHRIEHFEEETISMLKKRIWGVVGTIIFSVCLTVALKIFF